MNKNDEFYGQIRDAYNIRDLLEMTNGDRCKCPQCGNESGDSAQVYDNHVVCFKCGNKGFDVISLFQLQNNFETYFQAAIELGKDKNIHPDYVNLDQMKKHSEIMGIMNDFCEKCHEALKKNNTLYEKIKNKRGFSDETMDGFHIGYLSNEVMIYMQEKYEPGLLIESGFIKNNGYFLNQKNTRIVYPYLDMRGKAKYFIYRNLIDNPDQRKYVKHQTTDFIKNQVFGLSHLYEYKKHHQNLPLILTEGITDCISVLSAGYPSISAVTTKFAVKDYDLLLKYCKKFKEVIVINDSEEPTEKMRERGIEIGAGLDGAQRTLEYLLKHDVNVFISEIPRPAYIKKIDLDMFLKVAEPFEAISELISRRKSAIDYFINNLNSSSTEEDIIEILRLIPSNRHAIRERALTNINNRTGLQRRTLNNIVRDLNNNENNNQQQQRAVDSFAENFYDSEFYQTTPFYYRPDRGWYIYNVTTFVYELINVDYITKLIYEWFEFMGLPQTNSNITDCLKQAKNKKIAPDDMFDDSFMALRNGVYNLITNEFKRYEEIEKPEDLMMIIQIPYPCDKEQIKPPELLIKMVEAFEYGKGDFPELGLDPIIDLKDGQPTDKTMWLQYLVNMIHLKPIDRFLVLLIGPPDAGKSPQIKLIYNLMKPITGNINLNKVGEMGELQMEYMKRILIDEDCNMGYANNDTMKFIKDNFSDDSEIKIRNLYAGRFSEKGNKYMTGGSNQAFRLPIAYNSSAIFKRLLPLICPNRYKRNVEMEEQMKNPEFLDQVFAYLLNQEVKPMHEGYDQIDLQNRNEILWNWSAFPLKRICEQLFEFSYDFSDEVLSARVVYSMIGREMEKQKMERPKKFFKQVENALAEMGIESNRKKEREFYGIKEKHIKKISKKPKFYRLDDPVMYDSREEIYRRWESTIELNPDVVYDPKQIKELKLWRERKKKQGDETIDDFDVYS